jgi:hypothetical protein
MSSAAPSIGSIFATADLTVADATFARIYQGIGECDSGPMADAMRDCAQVIMAAYRTRFGQQSQGGGEWPDLALVTKIRRAYKQGIKVGRKGSRRGIHRMAQIVAGMKFLILKDTLHLVTSLHPGELDYFQMLFSTGTSFGTYDPKTPKHQRGSGRIPVRRILVPLDSSSMPNGVTEKVRDFIAVGIQRVVQAASLV